MMLRAARNTAILGAVTLLTATGATTTVSAASLPAAWAGGSLAVRPKQIGYTGDGSGLVGGRRTSSSKFGHIRWTAWTTTRATGTASIWLDDCEPSCANGTFHPYRGTVRLTRPSNGTFRRLALRFTYHGRRVTDLRRLTHDDGYYGWAIVKQSGF